jgi:hypothetical protein
MPVTDLVEHCRGELDRIEQRMMREPEMIPHLRQQRSEAQAMLLDAELRLAAEERALERRPTRAELWAYWQDCRLLGRRRMSAKTKARAVRLFGRELYSKLPW